MKHECVPLESRDGWKDALQGIRHSFAHTWESCRAMNLSTGHCTYLYCFENETARIICPVAERRYHGYVDVVTPYGFSGFAGTADCPDFPHYWREFAQRRGYVCGYFGLHPAFANATYAAPDDVHRSNTLYCLDLTQGIEQLLQHLDNNRKRQLKTAQQRCFDVTYDRTQIKQFVIAQHDAFMQRVGGSHASRFSKETLGFLCELEQVFAVGATGREGIVAVSLFGYTSFGGEYLMNVPLPQGRGHATMLLWRAAGELKQRGVPMLNLGGGIREGDTVAEYKRRFGGFEAPFHCLKQVYDVSAYSMLCSQAHVDPNDRAGYFPAYRQSR